MDGKCKKQELGETTMVYFVQPSKQEFIFFLCCYQQHMYIFRFLLVGQNAYSITKFLKISASTGSAPVFEPSMSVTPDSQIHSLSPSTLQGYDAPG
jgi:hypothetical protein